jgi:hypothetical protein
MKNDVVINRIAHTMGVSRKEVLDTLKQLGMLSGGFKNTNKGKYGVR